MLKDVPSGGTGVENLRREEAIWTLKCKVQVELQIELRQRVLAGGTAQKRQQTWESDNTIRCGSHWGGSLQDELRDE